MSWVEKNPKINNRGGTIIRDSRVDLKTEETLASCFVCSALKEVEGRGYLEFQCNSFVSYHSRFEPIIYLLLLNTGFCYLKLHHYNLDTSSSDRRM